MSPKGTISGAAGRWWNEVALGGKKLAHGGSAFRGTSLFFLSFCFLAANREQFSPSCAPAIIHCASTGPNQQGKVTIVRNL
jgi:hypothetical protein